MEIDYELIWKHFKRCVYYMANHDALPKSSLRYNEMLYKYMDILEKNIAIPLFDQEKLIEKFKESFDEAIKIAKKEIVN